MHIEFFLQKKNLSPCQFERNSFGFRLKISQLSATVPYRGCSISWFDIFEYIVLESLSADYERVINFDLLDVTYVIVIYKLYNNY